MHKDDIATGRHLHAFGAEVGSMMQAAYEDFRRLEQRIEQLEQRVQELERGAKDGQEDI